MGERNTGRNFSASMLTAMPQGLDEKITAAKARALEMAKDGKMVESLVGYIDLTTLSGDDTPDKVRKLFARAAQPLPTRPELHCAAVCVYPQRLLDVKAAKEATTTPAKPLVATVAAGFPSGQFRLETKIAEVRLALDDGADEVDIVISRALALTGQWEALHREVKELREACGDAHCKTILAVGELGKGGEGVWKASLAALYAGSDFIKTSTGKEAVNANLADSALMLEAIRQYKAQTGVSVGFKPAGGIRKVSEALEYVALVEAILGPDWLNPKLFRIGASSLLDDVLDKFL